MKNELFEEMTKEELMDTDGGVIWYVVAGVVVVAGLGVYNGWKDTAAGK